MDNGPTLRRLGGKLYRLLGRTHKLGFVAITFMMLFSAGLNQVVPLAIGHLTDSVITESSLTLETVIPYLFLILCGIVLNEFLIVARRLVVEDTATRTDKTARQNAIAALLHAPLAYFRTHMTGNIHGRLNRSLEGTTRLIKLLFMDFAPSVFSAAAAIVVIFVKLPLLVAAVTVLVVPIGTLIVLRQISTQRGIRVELLGKKAAMDGSVVELLGGIETIRVTDNTDFEEGRFRERSEELRSREMRHHYAMAWYDCLKFTNEAFFNVLVVGTSVFLAVEGRISVGTILTSYLCFLQLTGPLRELHRILDELSESAVLAGEYFRISEIPRDFSYEPAVAADGTEERGEDGGNGLVIADLRFTYPERPDREILHDITVAIRPGEFVGIAGPSGCGKSSFIKAVAKLEPASGRVIIDGAALEELTRGDIARKVALIPQSPFLIADSVFNNICYGCRDGADVAAVREAARRACIDADIMRMDGGYDFLVSEGGANLSGGQCQRIALARIFLRKPRLLILDEATSALDNTSERHVQAEIEKMQRDDGVTIISIAHRLTTLANCDRILVFDQGRIVQEGKYAELTTTPGLFRDMHQGKLR